METIVEILAPEKKTQLATTTWPEIARTKNQSFSEAYNKSWQNFQRLYAKSASFSEQVRLAKVHALIASTLRCHEHKRPLKWIWLAYSGVSVNSCRSGAIRRSPFLKHKVFCRGIHLNWSLSMALMQASEFIKSNCFLFITDGRKFRTRITLTKQKCL